MTAGVIAKAAARKFLENGAVVADIERKRMFTNGDWCVASYTLSIALENAIVDAVLLGENWNTEGKAKVRIIGKNLDDIDKVYPSKTIMAYRTVDLEAAMQEMLDLVMADAKE